MRIVFFGTPDYVVPVLAAVHKKFVTGPGKSPISAVVTQSPKPTGRKQFLSYSAVDKWAHEHQVTTYYKASDLLKERSRFDLGILASYGEIIKKDVINLFTNGILVIHPSLLPKYRGASPIPEAIKNGESVTGVTIFKMDEKVDHGPIVSQFKEEIQPTDDAVSLRERLFAKSADVLVELIDPYLKGKVRPRPQDDTLATFTKIMKKEDGYLDFKIQRSPTETFNFIRAMQPWPGAWTMVDSKRLKILSAHLEGEKLLIDEVQLEGKNPVLYKQFREAYPNAELEAKD